MTKTQAAMNWCTAHGYQLQSISTKGHHMDILTYGKWAGIAILCAIAYGIGKQGLKTFWSDVTSVYAWIRNTLSGSKTTTATAVTTSTPTPAVVS